VICPAILASLAVAKIDMYSNAKHD